MRSRCVCGCRKRGVHRHHVVYEQHVVRAGGKLKDARNLVWLAFDCHLAHHGRSRVLPLGVLPDSVFVFASELLGAGAAFEYLRRRYAGEDARLDALLGEAA
jgi:hypothetical protein